MSKTSCTDIHVPADILRRLRTVAGEHNDHDQVLDCNRALEGDSDATTRVTSWSTAPSCCRGDR